MFRLPCNFIVLTMKGSFQVKGSNSKSLEQSKPLKFPLGFYNNTFLIQYYFET